MATVAVRGSAVIATNGTTWATTTNAVDGAVGVNNATYATYTNATSGAVGYIELGTFGFSSTIGAGDTINSVTVNLRHFENNTARFASVRFQPYDGATAIGSLFTATLATAARNDSTTFSPTLAQLRSSTFLIRVTITGAASTQSRVESIDYVDVTVDYTPAPAITQAAYRWYADSTESGLVVASYDETNQNSSVSVNSTQTARAQSFLGTGQPLTAAGCYMSKLGTPTGTVTAKLYAHTGTFGTSSGLPTGAALATSTTTLDPTSLPVTPSWVWTYFAFDGTFTPTNGTAYCIALEASGAGNGSNAALWGLDSTTPTHAGRLATFAGSWSSPSDWDCIFQILTSGALAAQDTSYAADISGGDVNLQLRVRLQTNATAVPSTDDFQLQYQKNSGTWTDVGSSGTVNAYASANLTDAAATTNRLGAGSGSFVAGEISETGLVTDLGWTASNYTEVLYSLTLKQADLTGGDTLAFRLLRNAATTDMTYTVSPAITIGGGGNATASPAVIARTVTIPAATPQASTTTTPALIARSALIPAATGSANALPTPALIARSVTLDAPTPQAGSTTTPAAIARTVALPAPTASGQTSGTASPGAITCTVAMPAPTTTGGLGATAAPAVIARTVAMDAPTPQAGSTTAPGVIARDVAVPTVTASGQSAATATPAVIARTVAVPVPTPQAGSSGVPAAIARTVTMAAATPQASSTTAPALIARSAAMPAPTTTAGLGATAAPTVIARSVAMDAPTPQAGSTGVPAVIARTVTIPATTTTAGLGATAAPALIARTVAVPAPTTAGGLGAAATPAVIARTLAMPVPTPQAGSTLTPATIARAATLGLVSATGASAGTTTPAVIARSVALPAPTPQASSVTSPALIARVVALPAPIAQAGTVRSVALIARVVVMPAPTASGTSTALATPATIARVVAIPAPTTTAGLGATATPATIARLVALPSATPNAGTVVAVAVIARLVVIHQATATAGASAYQLYYGATQVVALYYGTIPIAGNNAHLG